VLASVMREGEGGNALRVMDKRQSVKMKIRFNEKLRARQSKNSRDPDSLLRRGEVGVPVVCVGKTTGKNQGKGLGGMTCRREKKALGADRAPLVPWGHRGGAATLPNGDQNVQ